MSYVALATTTLGSAAGSVTFSSIPATYKDLIVVADFTGSGNALVNVNFNGDTSNRTRVGMFGDSSSAGSFTASNIVLGAALSTTRTASVLQIMDYSATDKHKTVLLRANNAGISDVSAQAGRWASTNAINTIALVPASGNLNSGTTISLYGVA